MRRILVVLLTILGLLTVATPHLASATTQKTIAASAIPIVAIYLVGWG